MRVRQADTGSTVCQYLFTLWSQILSDTHYSTSHPDESDDGNKFLFLFQQEAPDLLYTES